MESGGFEVVEGWAVAAAVVEGELEEEVFEASDSGLDGAVVGGGAGRREERRDAAGLQELLDFVGGEVRAVVGFEDQRRAVALEEHLQSVECDLGGSVAGGQGEELVTPAKADETTAGDYRFEVPLPPGKTTFTVETRSHMGETISIADGRPDALLHAAGRFPAKARAVIEKAAAIKQRQAKAEAELASLDATEAKLVADQTRVRETLAVVGVGTRSGANYQKRLDELEDRLVALAARQEALRHDADAAAAELSEYLAGQDFSEDA